MASIAFASRMGEAGFSFSNVFAGLLAAPKAVVQWNRSRLARNALYMLSDKQLDDIGIARGDIASLTFGALKRF